MALSTMDISDIFTKLRYTLQDSNGTRWTDSELYIYLDEAVKDIALRTMYYRISQDISVVVGTEEYDLSHEMIKFDTTDTVQDYEITNGTTLTIEDATAEDINFSYYAYPPTIIEGTDTTVTLEQDMYELVRWFILGRCYEKEDSTELLAKGQYFLQRYMEYMNQNMSRWHGALDVTLAKSDYYA